MFIHFYKRISVKITFEDDWYRFGRGGKWGVRRCITSKSNCRVDTDVLKSRFNIFGSISRETYRGFTELKKSDLKSIFSRNEHKNQKSFENHPKMLNLDFGLQNFLRNDWSGFWSSFTTSLILCSSQFFSENEFWGLYFAEEYSESSFFQKNNVRRYLSQPTDTAQFRRKVGFGTWSIVTIGSPHWFATISTKKTLNFKKISVTTRNYFDHKTSRFLKKIAKHLLQ